jgi:ribosomal protein L40E/energy-coupling factor transporter transmembrane protein EcfT
MADGSKLRESFEDFKKKRYAIPIGLLITAAVTCVVLITTYYMCFSYAVVAVRAVAIPYYFGLKEIKKLALFGLVLFLFLGIAFGVSSFYEWKGVEGDPVGSESGIMVNGTMTRMESGIFQYSVFIVDGNGSEEVYVITESQWAESISRNNTLVPLGSPSTNGQLYVNNTTIPEGVYYYYFAINDASGWKEGDYGIGPINVPDEEFLSSMLLSRVLLVYLNIAILYFILLGLIYWTRSSKKRYGQMKKEKEELSVPRKKLDESEEAKMEEKFICSECGAEVPADAKMCPQCGEPFEEEEEKVKMICSSCGAEVDEDAESCWNCGKKFKS